MTRRSNAEPDPGHASTQRLAPGDLRILQEFLNTESLDRTYGLASPSAFAEWLARHELIAAGTRIGEDDMERAAEVRETIRRWLARSPVAEGDGCAERLDRIMETVTVRMRFASDGRIRFEPVPEGLDAALARLGSIMAQAQSDGAWQRMKLCKANNCGTVFFDDSKNHSRKWCSTRCGSRSSSLAYRHRDLETVRRRERGNAYRRQRYLA